LPRRQGCRPGCTLRVLSYKRHLVTTKRVPLRRDSQFAQRRTRRGFTWGGRRRYAASARLGMGLVGAEGELVIERKKACVPFEGSTIWCSRHGMPAQQKLCLSPTARHRIMIVGRALVAGSAPMLGASNIKDSCDRWAVEYLQSGSFGGTVTCMAARRPLRVALHVTRLPSGGTPIELASSSRRFVAEVERTNLDCACYLTRSVRVLSPSTTRSVTAGVASLVTTRCVRTTWTPSSGTRMLTWRRA
jgi:hypothetical protein